MIPANFHGVKGRSGRKTWDKEIEMKKLWDLSIPVLKYGLTSDKVTPEKRIDIALELIKKMIPQNVKGEGFNTNVFINNIKNILEDAHRLNAGTITR